MPLIEGGYIILSRKLIESEIWKKPPLYLKIWIYILTTAQHKQYKGLKRGQLTTSIPEIIEACSWYSGYRKIKPTKDQIYQIIEWLRKPCGSNDESNNGSNAGATMITTTRATQSMVINVVNYSVYQDSKNYGSNDGSNDGHATGATTDTLREQRQPNNINKNVKNDKKKEKKKEYAPSRRPSPRGVAASVEENLDCTIANPIPKGMSVEEYERRKAEARL